MNLSVNELFKVAEKMEEMLGTDELLLSLLKQMSSDDLQEALEYIDRMQETNLFNHTN